MSVRASRQTEEELLRLARGGSREAQAELFTRRWDEAWRRAFAIVGRRAAADDVAQDAFLRAFANLAGFDGGPRSRPGCTGSS